jgi:preprotein translocase subunit YajC|tara:strand:- start:670 stop:996 length:327 start_codon:yes stop_codon:yes gene_type:complete
MIFNILLQVDAAGESDFSFIILLGGMFLIMYFFMIRPQMKRQKEAKSFRSEISKGDKVVTIGGVHGKVVSVSDLTIVLELESGKVRVDKTAVSPTGNSDEQDLELKKA